MEDYFGRRFSEALEGFRQVQEMLGEDYLSGVMAERCQDYIQTPPAEDWTGVDVMTSK
jgi:adenylate cyclase